MSSNIFFSNNAVLNGGGIKIKSKLPINEDFSFKNKYMNNTAIYGKNIATYPIRISFSLKNGAKEIYSSFHHNKKNLNLKNPPGISLSSTFNFTLSDHFDQIVSTETSRYIDHCLKNKIELLNPFLKVYHL